MVQKLSDVIRKTIVTRILKLTDSYQVPLIIFFGSLFLFLSFGGTRLFFSDEGVILNQFYNFINGSLALESFKINTTKGVFIVVGNHLYGKFSYSLIILSLPVYYVLKIIYSFYDVHLFILHVWALSGGFVVYLITKAWNSKHPLLAGAVSYIILMGVNLYFYRPIYFSMWGELLSIELTNILISSFLVLLVYLLFRDIFSARTAIFASFFLVFATPVPFYAITLKHHALSLFLTVLSFYLYYRFHATKENKFIYFAYASAALCVWTRTLDGAVLLTSLLIADMVTQHRIKHALTALTVIIIALLPFFVFNYLILGHPFSIMETVPLADRPIDVHTGTDFITLGENADQLKQGRLLNSLGYTWNTDVRTGWQSVILDITFLKTVNTFGIFLVSPFLITALAFVLDIIKHRIKLNTMDRILGLYVILIPAAYSILSGVFNMNYLIYIIRDTPIVLEYRYLLIMYIILLYFAMRIDKIRYLIENNFNTIIILYGILLLVGIMYFITEFPLPFLDIYNHAAFAALILLITPVSLGILVSSRNPAAVISDRITIFIIALSLALASGLLLFYYWVVNMTYISPSQNHAILPAMENMIQWMYHTCIH